MGGSLRVDARPPDGCSPSHWRNAILLSDWPEVLSVGAVLRPLPLPEPPLAGAGDVLVGAYQSGIDTDNPFDPADGADLVWRGEQVVPGAVAAPARVVTSAIIWIRHARRQSALFSSPSPGGTVTPLAVICWARVGSPMSCVSERYESPLITKVMRWQISGKRPREREDRDRLCWWAWQVLNLRPLPGEEVTSLLSDVNGALTCTAVLGACLAGDRFQVE
jgi:hypothetical protein